MIKTIISTALPADEHFRIEKNVFSNGKQKKRICIVTGTHGDELEGQLVAFQVAKRLRENPGALNGTVEIYPALNPLGIDTIQRGIPNFDLDMNRIFPGNHNGTMAEQTAFAILEDLKGADLVIDIHSSNLYLRETPQVRINVNDEKRLVPLAEMMRIDFIWVHDAATVLEATLAHSLNATGTPCLVAEMGVGMRVNHSMCRRLTDGIFNLISHLGVWTEPVDISHLAEPMLCKGDSVEFLNADTSGVFLTEKRTGTYVSSGECIGQIVSPMEGIVRSEVIAPCGGFLFTLRAYPIVYEGSLMARICRI